MKTLHSTFLPTNSHVNQHHENFTIIVHNLSSSYNHRVSIVFRWRLISVKHSLIIFMYNINKLSVQMNFLFFHRPSFSRLSNNNSKRKPPIDLPAIRQPQRFNNIVKSSRKKISRQIFCVSNVSDLYVTKSRFIWCGIGRLFGFQAISRIVGALVGMGRLVNSIRET